MLKIDEFVQPDGSSAITYLHIVEQRIMLLAPALGEQQLPIVMIAAVMKRYGRAFDSDGPIAGQLTLPDGARLWMFRHHAIVDATGRDYLAWQSNNPAEPALACVAVTVAAALRHLAGASRQ
jgi:hypothetical protein